jgi:hypothetical protein
VGPRAGVDDVEKRKFLTLPGLELRPIGRLARSQSLYRLRYPGSFIDGSMDWILDLLTTCIHHTELHFTNTDTHRLVSSVSYSLH